MHRSLTTAARRMTSLALAAAWLSACGPGGEGGAGGTSGLAGASATGGTDATGTGGAATGGMGGGSATGGSSATGGTGSTGGASATGGTSATGGSGAKGGSGGTGTGGVATGGSGGSGGHAPGGAAGGAGGHAGGSSGGGGSPVGGAAGGTPGSGTCGGGAATSSDVTVNLSDLHQKISGFGASTAWGSTMSATDADLLWSTTSGAGLSLHRVRIDYTNGHTSELNIAKQAVAHGVTVWATPWTPPTADKSNASSVEGTLTNPAAYATFLAGFVTYMKGQGVPIYAVSAGNEPDANVTYESCVYTGATMASWLGGYLGPALAPMGVKVMAPETQNWCGFPGFESALLGDANAKMYTDIVATHEYGCSVKAYPEIAQAGKEFWETEIYDTTTNTADTGMGSALRVGKLIHDAMTVASMNAWHYWWVYPGAADNGALWDQATAAPTKRLWVEGNYARFVRPGFQRVGTSGTAPSGVLVSAYTNPADGTVAIVAINNNTSSTPLSLFISGAAPCALTPWVTSASDSLASKSTVSVASSRGTFALPGQSVTTLVGRP